MDYSTTVDVIGKIIDMIGVFIIVFGILFSLVLFLLQGIKRESKISPYTLMKQTLGKTIIIGLEILIAGDIVRSIAVPPTLINVSVLAIIVFIRAFLAVQMENGASFHFPWNIKRVNP